MKVYEVEDLVLPMVAEQAEVRELTSWSRCAAMRDHRTAVLFEQHVKELGIAREEGVRRMVPGHTLSGLATQELAYRSWRKPTLTPYCLETYPARRGSA